MLLNNNRSLFDEVLKHIICKKILSPYYIQISKHKILKLLFKKYLNKYQKLPEYKLLAKSHLISLFTISLKVLNLKIIKAFGSSIREAESKAANEA